jgi:homoserine dehydrogenase
MAEKRVKIGIVGLGTVGCGVVRIIADYGKTIKEKTGLMLEIGCAVDTDTKRQRQVILPDGVLTNDINRLLNDKSITIGLELVGGTTVAKDIQLKMLQAGKDVVTANKALLAKHGSELFAAARKNNRCIAFEASCAGGVPIISALRTGLIANDITGIYGIVNGTCNYILSRMSSQGESFEEVLARAKQRGYAEADPTIDINGQDSAHKLAILASIALGCEISLDDIYVEGIEGIQPEDIRYGKEMGYVLKLLAIGQKDENGRIYLRVHPCFISRDNALARVEGPFNAISVFGNAVGQVTFYGRGAGMMATASAVVADIIDVALGNSANTFKNLRIKLRSEASVLIDKIDNLVGRFYIRIMCKDQPGVIAQWSKVLAEYHISISGALQHEGIGPDNTVPVVITTHPTAQKNINATIAGMEKLDVIGGKPVCIRIVDIPEDREQ